jgi:hypothetical protein
MPGFPLTDPDLFPVPLGDVLRALHERGHFIHLSVSALSEGGFQASFRTGERSSYRVEMADDPVEAILKAVSPCYGHTWAELLGPAFAEADEIAENRAEEEDDDLEDVLG